MSNNTPAAGMTADNNEGNFLDDAINFLYKKGWYASDWNMKVPSNYVVEFLYEYAAQQCAAKDQELKEKDKEIDKINHTLTEQGKMYYELNQEKESIQHHRDELYDETVLLKSQLKAKEEMCERLASTLKENISLLRLEMLYKDETCNRMDKAHSDYEAILLDEIDSLVGMAYVHGWRSKNVEAGKVARDKINDLRTEYNNSKQKG